MAQDTDQTAKYNLTKYMECLDKLEAVSGYIGKLRDQSEKSGDIFERGFCRGIAYE